MIQTTLQTDTSHTDHSAYRESVIEHMFLGSILQYLWNKGIRAMEVLTSEVDDSGYDLILEYASIIRHIQLKSSFQGAATHTVNIHTKLQQKPAGCVIWIIFDKDTLAFKEFLWFGGTSKEPLPPLTNYPTAKHTKRNAQGQKGERPGIRVLRRNTFKSLSSMAALVEKLFDIPA